MILIAIQKTIKGKRKTGLKVVALLVQHTDPEACPSVQYESEEQFCVARKQRSSF